MDARDASLTADEQRAEFTEQALDFADEVMRDNLLSGLVRKVYVAQSGQMWVYGYHRWPVMATPDDPMGNASECGLNEFKAYLRDWYWPQKTGNDDAQH